MKRTRRSLVLGATVVALLASSWGTGTSAAWPPEGDRPDPASLPAPGNPGEQRSVIDYGPHSIEAAPQNPDGSHGEAMSGNQFTFDVEKPCTDCYITGMQPDLVDAATGESVGIRDGVKLHHMVMLNNGRDDVTCGGGLGLLGQRFFASGDERTPKVFPQGHGYHTGDGTWNLVWMLSNEADVPQTVNFQVTFDWVPASAAGDMTDVDPVWLDLNQCGSSEIDVPAGESQRSYTWTADRSGDIVQVGGHVHDGGVNLEIVNETTGELICDSRAGYGGHPLYYDHHGDARLSTMSTCGGTDDPDFAPTVVDGDQVTITGHYDMPQASDHQMGIATAYLARDESGDDDCAWWQALFGWC